MAITAECSNADNLLVGLHNGSTGHWNWIGNVLPHGCQSPIRQALPGANAPASDIDIDEELWERAEPGEVGTDQLIADAITGYINRRYSDGRRPAMRDAHAKTHGCVRATVDTGLPNELRKGVFAPGKSYRKARLGDELHLAAACEEYPAIYR